MTENEIINILKENKKNGIGWNFLPEQVKIWTRNIMNYNKCIRFNGEDWIFLNDINVCDKTDNTEIIALPEDFELKKKSEGEWVEFEIDKDGEYHLCSDEHYHWSEWNNTLRENYCNSSFRLTAFGGWQYEEDNFWYMEPQLIDEEGNYHSISNFIEKVTPIIPKKIRFWRKYN